VLSLTTTHVYTRVVPVDLQKVHAATAPSERRKKLDVPEFECHALRDRKNKARPVLIVSREDEDPPRALVIHVPMATQNRGSRYEVDPGKLPFLREASFVNLQGITSVPTVWIKHVSD